ncbi:hypothetical protein BD311DRAFT_343684 [Dichomitus squalens]|uniref:Uncharacterized protein n=1 Tax=Dichomitus squalens TaxID=114155 RepID=A0A4Q9N0Z9_9APHY|nr:hypothetical protein BD311DRAFT_343684 [Dichomitus squalens]
MFASHEQKSCRARLGARHTTLCSKPLSTFEAGRFCSIHRKELSRLDAAYHKASERKESLQGVAITERSQISGLELPGDVETARVVTVEYLEALKEECKGRKAVHERFFWDGE